MTKKKITKKLNKNFNIFDNGGEATTSMVGKDSTSMIGEATTGILSSVPNINEGKNTNGIESDIYTAIYGDSSQNPIARMVNDLTGNSTKNVINKLNQKDKFNANNNEDLVSKWNDIGILNTYNTDKNLVGKTLLSTALGAPWLDFKNNGVQFDTDNLIASAKGAAKGSSFGPWGALAGGILGGVANLASRMGRNNRINKINEAINNRNNYNLNNYNNVSSNINKQSTYNMLSNYYAEGGDMNNGGDFSNGVTIIGNGGTHEENPMNGVPMGIAPDGIPNFVEQDEVKFNNYIFSNRLNATTELLKIYNLPTTYANHSFAYIAKKLSKESSERPNDPISKKGLTDTMMKLQQAQEQLRMKEQSRKYAKEGYLFAGGGPAGMDPILYEDNDEHLIVSNTGSSLKVKTPSVSKTNNTKSNNTKSNNNFTWLRYAPAVGAGLGVLTDAIGLTNKPDYDNADLVGNAVNNLTDVRFNPIGNYLTYRPLDRNYYTNKLNAQAGATRRAIVNQSGGNRATALASLLAADYNAQNSLGDLARQAEEYNFNQRKEVEAFNRGTNQFNSEMALKTALANKENEKTKLLARIAQAKLRDQADTRSSAGRLANLTNFFDSLGNIGIDEMNRADRDMLIRAGVFGTLSEKPQGWSNKRWEDYKKAISGNGYSNGGKLKKRRGGLTY